MPSFEPNDHERILQLERDVAELARRKPRTQRIGDLRNVRGFGALDGYQFFYDTSTGQYRPAMPPPLVVFHQFGPVEVKGSGHFPLPAPGSLFLARAKLKTAGTSTTTALLKYEATTVATFSFTSGNVWPTTVPTVDQAFDGDDDYLWMDVTAAGTDAEDLVMNVWAKAGSAP